ncbi:uncharacterized protein GGS22DRAFT_174957 [Annulohypoxylon maeteangense]|uniref:uncharacterized protein n=1 Tax=Annulohypoxylon maeteangense TaxID=1927788 RepID=UPI002008864C|nr:uncharacterized protein GGS22DRAFT_174957 [Annulohypoxylon maeteangense]KAI0880474.1 hypothetical protein GGS22DRAFT_174957 [Annulohypoxylon maeteangense]
MRRFYPKFGLVVRRSRCPVTRPARIILSSAAPLRNFSPSSSLSSSPKHLSRGPQSRTMASSSNPFSTLLTRDAPTARLAILQPAEDQDAPIELTLTEAVLKDTSYECISYDRSASAADTTETVSVDGVSQAIPKHLADALRTFRRKERPRTLWADVLAGRTPAELSAQAGTQRAVLEGAERTLCWLGADKGLSTTKAFATIAEMGRRFEDACRSVGLGPDDRLSAATMQQMEGLRGSLINSGAGDLNSFDFGIWDEIYDVFGASYWSSVQAVADIVLARAPVVVCGRSNIRWSSYIAASRAMPLYQAKFFGVPMLPSVFKGFEIANQIEIAERRRRLGESIELLPMVQTARDCGPRDVRESVFSMLLIATPSRRVEHHNAGPQPLPTIDYGKTPQQVFTEMARYSVLERQDLMLWYAERPPCARRLKGLPSWVPDFGAMPPKIGSLFNPISGMRHWWETIRPETAKKPITVSEDNALCLQARPLDRIVHVSPIFNAGNARRLCYTEFQKLHEAISSSSNSSSSDSPSPPNPFSNEPFTTTTQRFWRTLILNSGGSKTASDTLGDNVAPPDSLGNAFESILAEEGILAALDCSMHELQLPENAARMRASPEIMSLLPRCGKAGPYEALLAHNTIGRRLFWTQGGRFGLSAVEDVKAIDPNLERDTERGNGDGKEDEEDEVEKRRMPELGRLMNDPMTRMMMEQFQNYLNERDPNMARVHAKAVRGALPEMSEDALGRVDDGVRGGDLVVACVGGFFPYILRPQRKEPEVNAEGAEAEVEGGTAAKTAKGASEDGKGKSNLQPTEATSEDSSTYEFVGECYLHGSMQGEDFQSTRFFGQKYFDVDVSKLVDIKIV